MREITGDDQNCSTLDVAEIHGAVADPPLMLTMMIITRIPYGLKQQQLAIDIHL